ncbi:maleylpyruvate isomerase family mycothiol-dependent enzyme [Herbiconiux sp. KACC 21604]|uniref:maleylpyruvate isomerase family mycothiol-dependent enzyme n=1 Tax=unclassified Herbiconiux TaxID=2618217 RepID=UPI001492C340|nr:maleylpyruvate isomerase family mycothiol-dependent enzyme [Herbiconiux sp. SALV-R1]QJU55326.1 maleylpyruvate isomerase family mycothiol-dependent enzyme [Herbiconiux sp. SALV-R1]WPO86494.1 maleylpyruvate isomerase family mycothiol-dependent enzyme [Herbiconiux sp. KACC 21604]
MVARTDLVTHPAAIAGLLLARRGQAYYSRKLNELTDAEFDGATLLPGWSRRELIAHVGLNARALTRLIEWAATGIETPMYESMAQRDEEIALSATLPALALRNLSDHAAIHLTVEWRDLPDADWSNLVRTAQGRTVPVSETVWMRTREVWIHAVDLANGGRFDDIPAPVIDRLLREVLSAWDRRRVAESLPVFAFEATDRSAPFLSTDVTSDVVLRGTAASLAQWATGRGAEGVTTAVGQPAPEPPHWL